MSIVQFSDKRLRVGGVSPKGPCSSADLTGGEVIVSVDDTLVDGMSVVDVSRLLTSNKGRWMKLGLYVDDQVDYSLLLDSETERHVWLQQGEAPSIGIRLASTDVGARITDFWPEGSHAKHSALQVGDILLRVNDNDVSGSSYDETLAAIVLAKTPFFSVFRDKTPIVTVPDRRHSNLFGSSNGGDDSISEADSRGPNTSFLRSPTHSTDSSTSMAKKGGIMKVVVLVRNETRGLGLQVCTASGDEGARVESILPGTPAEVCGKIKVGDHILQANRMDLRTSTHEEVHPARSPRQRLCASALLWAFE